VKRVDRYTLYTPEGSVNLQKNVLGLLEQIKDTGLTVQEAYFVLEQAKRDIEERVMCSQAVK
jgi:hypothetical protein